MPVGLHLGAIYPQDEIDINGWFTFGSIFSIKKAVGKCQCIEGTVAIWDAPVIFQSNYLIRFGDF